MTLIDQLNRMNSYTTTCRNQYVFSGKYKKKELVHLPISTGGAGKCKKEGLNIVFLRRKGTWTDLDISTCKTPAAAFQLLTSKDFDSAPRAHQNKLMILDTLPTPFAIKMFAAKQNILLHNVIFSLRGFVTRGVMVYIIRPCLILMNGKPDTVQQKD